MIYRRGGDDVKSLIEEFNLDLAGITDPNLRKCFVGQLNIIQQLVAEEDKQDKAPLGSTAHV